MDTTELAKAYVRRRKIHQVCSHIFGIVGGLALGGVFYMLWKM